MARARADERMLGWERVHARSRRFSLLGRPDGSLKDVEAGAVARARARERTSGDMEFWRWAARKNNPQGGFKDGVARTDRLGRRVVARMVGQTAWERYRSTDARWVTKGSIASGDGNSSGCGRSSGSKQGCHAKQWLRKQDDSGPNKAKGAALLQAALSALDPHSAAHAAAAERRVVEREKEDRIEMLANELNVSANARPRPFGRFYEGIIAS